MSSELRVPALGESVVEATIVKWLKQVGDPVKIDEGLVELETEKVSVEVPSPFAGILESQAVAEGEDIAVGALLCMIAEGEAGTAPETSSETSAAPAKPESKPEETALPDQQDQSAGPSPHLSPAPARIARQEQLDPAAMPATGPKGNITKQDAMKATDRARGALPQQIAPPPPAAPSPVPPAAAPLPPRAEDPRGEERVRMSKLRKVVARRLKDAQNSAAMLSTFNEVNMRALMALRKEYREAFEVKHGSRLGFMSFFVKAAIGALQEIPAINAEIYGDEIIYRNYYDIGVAVGSPQGLVVPVLRDANMISFAEIESRVADFGKRARAGKLEIGEMLGGTFTITNGGVFGSLLSTPILNPPQSGILGMHKIQMRPICEDDEIVAAPMMYLALTYDHRIVDGREAVTFLVKIKERLEDPARLMLDV